MEPLPEQRVFLGRQHPFRRLAQAGDAGRKGGLRRRRHHAGRVHSGRYDRRDEVFRRGGKTIDELQALLDSDKTLVDDFVRYAARKGVAPRYGDIVRSRRLIEAQLRAYIGRNTALEDNGFYANIYPVDNVVVRAIGILKEENEND